MLIHPTTSCNERGCCGPQGDDAMFQAKLFHVLINDWCIFTFQVCSCVRVIRLDSVSPSRRKALPHVAHTVRAQHKHPGGRWEKE